ncbi:hypothetical protein BO70DRAFT_418361 [Aspergillus heteromorphus CBS 117.55]|uniref:Uncharacterized protein n=1 Tax=Aspergillus heteromorphus CBS 117.55 TaxID=1448321 RepID=A0A317WS10_9EURO|nr:uncharacterized protein BO70DRAFT_418361 [Aspergillus heteromorphus CBS 117.55]PWY89236.1 hypothetical protein BO70DRAFT_418361 [Aspergillus heteromorphus CBS 117.55]
MAKGAWAPREHRVVRDELTKLQEGLRLWARTFSVGNIADLQQVSSDQLDMVIEALNGYCVQKNWRSLAPQIPIPPNRVPMVFIQALLAKSIFSDFTDPFLLLGHLDHDLKLPGKEEMQNLYQIMIRGNEAEAHVWRSQTLRVLSASANDTKLHLSRQLERVVNIQVAAFLSGPAHVLLRQVKNNEEQQVRASDLHKLYSTAGTLALSLWTQRTYIVCRGVEPLQVFDSSDTEMTAHRFHHLDEDDNRLDGNPILVCVQPAVLAFGNENGEDYDKKKLWAKATVLVAEDKMEQSVDW